MATRTYKDLKKIEGGGCHASDKILDIAMLGDGTSANILFIFIFYFFYFLLFGAVPTAYRSSQVGGQIRATAAGLCHSQGNTGSLTH